MNYEDLPIPRVEARQESATDERSYGVTIYGVNGETAPLLTHIHPASFAEDIAKKWAALIGWPYFVGHYDVVTTEIWRAPK